MQRNSKRTFFTIYLHYFLLFLLLLVLGIANFAPSNEKTTKSAHNKALSAIDVLLSGFAQATDRINTSKRRIPPQIRAGRKERLPDIAVHIIPDKRAETAARTNTAGIMKFSGSESFAIKKANKNNRIVHTIIPLTAPVSIALTLDTALGELVFFLVFIVSLRFFTITDVPFIFT